MENENKSLPELASYNFGVIDLIKEGWARMEGSKLQLFIAFVVYVLVSVVLSFVLSLVFPQGSVDNPNTLNQLIVTLISYPVLIPMMTGMMMMALSHGRGEQIEFQSIFNYYHLTGKLSLASIFSSFLMFIGFILLLLPGIYLAVAYMFVLPLIVDKNMGIWEAMEYSRKKVTQQWFKVFGLMFLLGLIVLLGAIPLGIGLFWAMPLMYICMYGLLYPIIFDGIEA
ncbi:MAG: hypothetical protein GQ531_08530 [Sulfurovum sp.]|nr:hypothetical protein [Sulfurovum sp.]